MTFQVPAEALPLLTKWFEREVQLFGDIARKSSDLDREGTSRTYNSARAILVDLRAGGAVRVPPAGGFFKASLAEDAGSALEVAWRDRRWADVGQIADVLARLDETLSTAAGVA